MNYSCRHFITAATTTAADAAATTTSTINSTGRLRLLSLLLLPPESFRVFFFLCKFGIFNLLLLELPVLRF